MYGQTSRAYQMLVDAYQVILERMHLKNLILPASMIAALCMGIAPSAKAEEYAQDPRVTRTLGLQTAVQVYYYDQGQPDFYTAPGSSGYATRYAEAVAKNNLMRQFFAVQSGGQFDIDFTYAQCQIGTGQTYSVGSLFNSNGPAVLVNNAPDLAAIYSSFNYHFSMVGDASNTGAATGAVSFTNVDAAGRGGGDNYWATSFGSSVAYHEFGHSLGAPHNGSFYQPTSAGSHPGYTYDFATRTYTLAPATIGGNPWTQPITSLPIGVRTQDGGNVFNRMAGGGPGTFDPLTKARFGWLTANHFAKITDPNVVALGQTATLKLYDASDLRLASKGTGANLRYGVQQGYQNVAYDASLTRLGQVFNTTTGKWTLAKQRLDFYYQGANTHYGETYPAGQVDPATQAHGIAVELGGRYIGTLQVGQTIDERTLSQMIARLGDDGDGVSAGTGTAGDYLLRPHDNPHDPRTFRTTHYRLTFQASSNADGSHTDDPLGVYANLQIESLTDMVLAGSQWDPGASGSASQDGTTGTWTTGSGSWRNLNAAVQSGSTTNLPWADGDDAVFGANAGTAGMVALGGNVSATSLTFAPVASATKYTITGGAGNSTLTLGGFGVVARDSATLACNVAFGEEQYWTVADNKTLTLSGAVTTNARNLIKMGQGTLALTGAQTWDKEVNVAEGKVVQSASQTFSSGSRLSVDSGAVYQVTGGTLALSSSVTAADVRTIVGAGEIAGMLDLVPNNPAFHGTGLLQLSSPGLITAPEVQFNSNATIEANMQLDAVGTGMHVISLQGGNGTITGDIGGAGGILLYGNSSARQLTLGGRSPHPTVNTFTGDIDIQRGSLHVVGATSLQSNGVQANKLSFNTGTGDSGRFYLEGFDRSVRDLSSAATGSAIIANSRAGNGSGGTRPANLIVTQNSNDTYRGTLVDAWNDGGGDGTAAGALGLVKKGAATLTLTGGNTYTGGTSIEAGTLRVKGADSLGTNTVRLMGGTLSIDQGQGLARTAIAGTSMNTAALTGSGSYTTDFGPLHNTTGNVVPSNTTYAYTGKIFLAAGQWNFGENFDAGAYLKINGTPILNNTQWWSSTTGSVVIAQDGWYDIDLRVFRGSGNVGPDNGDKGWTTQGIGVHFSPTTGAAPANGSSYVAFDPGALGLKLKNQLTLANNIAVDADSTLEILDTESLADVRLTGAISGTAALTKTGAGMVTLAGANTHTGATRISGGIVAAGAADVLGSASAYTLDNTAGVALNLNGHSQTIGSLAGGGVAGGNIALGGATLTVGGDNTHTSYSGTVTGTGGLNKVGSGTLRFDFANAGVASNILSATTALTVGGGTLEWQSKSSGATNTQTVNGLTLVANTRSALKLTQIGTGTVDLRLGGITTAAGATLDFQGGTGVAEGARFSYTTVNGASIAAGSRLGAFATWNGTDWAANSGVSDGVGGTYIGAYTGYINIYNGGVLDASSVSMDIPNQATADVKINEATSGFGNNTMAGGNDATINSLMMSAAGNSARVDLAGKRLTVGDGANAAGGIAVAVGAKGLTLGLDPTNNPGTLTSGTSGASTLGLISNNALAVNGLTINAVIANGGTGTTALVVSGGTNGGTVVLAGTNTYSGGTSVVSGATLQVGAGGGTGTLGLGAVALDAGTRLVFARTDAGLVVSSVISGAGALTQGGAGTTTLTGANTYAGATTILSGGTLRIGDGTTNGSLGSAGVTNDGTLAFNSAAATSMTVSNIISGSGTVTQVGAGTTVLTGANSYGATLVSSGTLQVGNGGTIGTLGAGAITVNTPGTLAFNRSDTLTVSNAIGGTGTLAQVNGSSTLILTGNNAYGATTIASGGKLQVGNGGTSGTLGTGTVTNAGTLEFNRSDTGPAVTARITGTGAVVKEGAGTTLLTGANDYSGTTTVNAGILQVGDGAAAGQLGSGLVALYGTLAFNRSDSLIVSNVFSGVGSITQAGVGTTIITSDNPLYSGAVTISAGTLQFGNGGVVGSMLAASIVNNGTLAYDHSNAVTVGGIISGTGNLIQKGSGTLTLTANNTYQGTTTVSGGTLILAGNNTALGTTTIHAGTTLQLGNGGSAGSSGTGNIVDDGTLIFNRTNTLTVSSVISGSGEVIQNGTGTVVLSGTNTYAGTTTINAGGLRLTSATASIGQGALTVNTGGSFSIGSGTDYMTVGVAQAVNLNGGTVSNDQWFATLNLDGPMSVGSAGATFSTHSADSSSGNNGGIHVNGVMSGSGGITLQNGRVLYGVGKVWFNNAGNTYSGTVTVPGVRQGGVTRPLLGIGASTALQHATLNLAPASSATAGTDLVAYASGLNAATVGGLTGNTWGGMKLQNGSTAVALTVNNAVANQFDGVLSGTGSLTKTGAGTLTLTNANTYAGGTTVSGGTLALDFSAGTVASNILESTRAVTLNGGTLKIIGPSATAGTVQTFSSLTSGAGTSTLQLVQTGSAAFDVNVGALSFGSGTLNFTGLTGTAAGARVITSTSAGANDSLTQLSVASALWEGSDWASVQLDGSGNKCVVKWLGTYTNVYTGTNGIAGNQSVVVPNNAAGNIQILENGSTGAPNTLAATTTTVASLLMKANVTASTIRINAGEALVVGAGANASGNVAIAATGQALTIGSVVGQGSLTAGSSGASTLSLASANAASALTVNANLVNNAGNDAVSLVAGGSGAIILKGANTYTGSTTIGSGTNLQVTGSLGTAGVYAGDIVDNGTLRLGFAGNQTLSGNLSGTGTLTRDVGASTDVLTLSGATNTISGNINISVGTLKVGFASALGSANAAMANGTTLDLNGLSGGTPRVTLGGTGVGGNGALISNVGGKGSIKGLTLSADALVSNTGFILVGSTTAQDGVFDLAGYTLTKRGSGTLALNGINANSDGNIVVEAGSLQVMDDYFSGGSQQATALGGAGTITIRSGAFLTTKRWASSLSLTKNIVLDGGTLRGQAPGPNGVTIASNISLTANSFVAMTNGNSQDNITLSGNITSTGAFGLTFSSGATTTLTGAISYTGNTTVSSGTVKIGGAGRLGAGVPGVGNYAGNISLASAGSILNFNSTANQTLSGVVSGAGKLTQSGSGTLILSNTNAYIGDTTVSGGILRVDGAHNATSGNYTINSGGTLGGIGAITTTGIVALSGGQITGADLGGVGDLTINAAKVSLAGSYLFDVDYAALSGAGDADTLLLTGAGSMVDFSGFAMQLNSGTGTASGNYSIKLMEWAGTANNLSVADGGTFLAGGSGGLAANQSVVRQGNALYLQVVPEPASFALLGLGSLLLLRRPTRRRGAAAIQEE